MLAIAAPNTGSDILVKGGANHLDLSLPTFGLVVIVYDFVTHELHLVGNMSNEAVKFIEDDWKDDAALHEHITRVTDNDNFLLFMGGKFEGFYHRNINLAHVTDYGTVVGGGAAYFDGHKLYLGDYPTQFGPMTETALKLCLSANTGIEVSFGPRVLLGDAFFCDKGLRAATGSSL